MLLVNQPGFQADFAGLPDSTLRDKFGLGAERVPPAGALNEVSAAAGNNVFRYRAYCAGSPSPPSY